MHALFIVSKAVAPWFNKQAELMGNKGDAVRRMELSKTGKEPGTHGWCAVSLSDAQRSVVSTLLKENPAQAAGIDVTSYDVAKATDHPEARLKALNLKLIFKAPKS